MLSRKWAGRLGLYRGSGARLADRGYMICATPRSGSTYLGQLLSSTGRLGKPHEYFNFTARQKHIPDYPKSPRGQLRMVLTEGSTENGIYALKFFPHHFGPIGAKIDLFNDLPDLRLVRLVRRDILGQAISLARAGQTRQFVAEAAQVAPPAYDQRRIRGCLERIIKDEQVWDGILARLDRRPLALEYEAVMTHPQGAVDQVAGLMGLSLPVPIVDELVSMAVQRDELSAAWRQQFLAETGDEFSHCNRPVA